jgi:type IV pilus assembly protein PilM
MLVDFGRARTGVAIAKHGIPIFTRTVGVGGDAMSQAVAEFMNVSAEEAEDFKNNHGLDPSGDPKVLAALTKTAEALAAEITRHYQYWDNVRDEHGLRVAKIDRVVLCGGNSNLRGLPEFIASKIHAPTERAEVWRNVASYDDYIPPIDREHSLGYATTIGLALRNG